MISVIVPAYNVKPYIERCVNSLVNQSYSNLEIILVDDGSTDGTGDMCDAIAKSDSRIKVIHKKNGGLSDARNAGIECATGEFYSFIDGDDFIELDTYERMLAEMEDENVSIVAGGFIVTDMQGNEYISVSPKRQYLTKEEAFMDLFAGENYIKQSSCNKLFRSELFRNIRYRKGILNEDMEILPKLLDACNHVVLIDKAIYHYIKKAESITTAKYSLERYKAIEIERDIYLMCKDKYPDLEPYASYYELKALHGMLCNLHNCSNRKDFKLQEWNIRRLMICVYARCNKWKTIRELYGREMKIFLINAMIGIPNVERLVRIKQKLMR